MKKLLRSQKGFTLIEILLVVAAIAILAGIVIVAINPGKQLGDTRNAQRESDATTILNATYQYSLDNNGVLPASITTTANEVCSTTGALCVAPLVDLGVLTLNEKYLIAIPRDPQATTTNGSGYFINRTANGRLNVSAPIAEQGKTIIKSR